MKSSEMVGKFRVSGPCFSLTGVRPSCSFSVFSIITCTPFSSIHVVPVLVSLPLAILMAMAGATMSTGTFFHCSLPLPRLSDPPTHPPVPPHVTNKQHPRDHDDERLKFKNLL